MLIFTLTLSLASNSSAQSDESVLYCAILNPDIATPKTVQNAFQPLLSRLTSTVNKEIKVVIYDNIDTAVADIKAGKIAFGYTGMIDYFRLESLAPIQPSLTMLKNGKTNYEACIAIRKSEEGATLPDLRGKRLGYISFHKFYGGFFPQILLKEQKLDYQLDHFFASTKGYFSDISAVQDLITGKIDVCIVSRDALDIFDVTAPWLINKITVMECQDGLMFAPIFNYSQLDEEINSALQNETIEFFKTPQGKQFMMMFKVDGVKLVTKSDYDQDRQRAITLGYINP